MPHIDRVTVVGFLHYLFLLRYWGAKPKKATHTLYPSDSPPPLKSQSASFSSPATAQEYTEKPKPLLGVFCISLLFLESKRDNKSKN